LAKINNFIFENANHNEISLYEAIRRIKIPTGSGTGTVTSVGLTMPSAFTVTGSPITTSGVFTVAGAGTSSQYIDGTGALQTFPTIPTGSGDMLKSVYDVDNDGVVDSAERVEIIVRNSTGSTLTKGQIVYLSGATGNRPNALLADASTEATSSKTIGMVVANIANNSDGYVAVNGTLHDLNTNSFTAGDTLWLDTTPGGIVANTPPAEPNHAVFIGYVARAHPTLGRIVLKIQNGFELNELHGVLISSETNNDLLVYETSSTLWKNKSLGTILGGTTSQYVRGDGTLATTPTGTVTGVTATSPITSSGGTAPVISTSMATNRLIGRSTAGTGVMEEIQLGNFLTLNSGVLSSVPPTPMSQDYAAAWNIAPTIVTVTTGGGSTGSTNSWLFVARYFSPNTAISQIGLRVDAFTTNVTLRLAIYDSTYDSTNARFVPNNRVANSGALSVTGLGFYSYSLPSSIQVSGWVFFAVGFTGAGCSWRNVAGASIIGLPAQLTTGTPQGTSSSGKNGRYDNTTVSTSADPPNPWSGTLNQNNANIPAVYFFIP